MLLLVHYEIAHVAVACTTGKDLEHPRPTQPEAGWGQTDLRRLEHGHRAGRFSEDERVSSILVVESVGGDARRTELEL